MTVTYKEYSEDKRKFFEKHNYDYVCDTSSMNEYGSYFKTYSFADGAQWCESMGAEHITTTVEVMKANVKVEVKMFRTEYWSTDNSSSKKYYEKF